MNPGAANTPADVAAEEGEVLVEGPGGVAYSFTPDAALETSDRLLHGRMQARGSFLSASHNIERSERQSRADGYRDNFRLEVDPSSPPSLVAPYLISIKSTDMCRTR